MGLFKKEKEVFYRLDRINELDCLYNMIIGERSNGKSYAVLELILKNYLKNNEQGAVIRRWDEDIKPRVASTFFDGHIANNLVRKYSDSKWDGVKFESGAWYLTRYDEDLDKDVADERPFCYAFAITKGQHYKSTSYPGVTTILFDEFLDRRGELPNEFVEFMNILSTIIRRRTNVKIYMCANTVKKSSQYFTEMGIKNIQKMSPGDIEVYQYGTSGLRLAIEYTDTSKKSKKGSDIYFAFDSPELAMITDGAWEMAMYPHCPQKYRPMDVRFSYFIWYNNELLQCDIIYTDDSNFTFIHRKTSDIKNPDEDLIFQCDYDSRPNYIRNITRGNSNKLVSVVYQYFRDEQVYYQDNEVGEIVREYIQWCKQN